MLYSRKPNITRCDPAELTTTQLKDTPGDVDIYVFDSGIPEARR